MLTVLLALPLITQDAPKLRMPVLGLQLWLKKQIDAAYGELLRAQAFTPRLVLPPERDRAFVRRRLMAFARNDERQVASQCSYGVAAIKLGEDPIHVSWGSLTETTEDVAVTRLVLHLLVHNAALTGRLDLDAPLRNLSPLFASAPSAWTTRGLLDGTVSLRDHRALLAARLDGSLFSASVRDAAALLSRQHESYEGRPLWNPLEPHPSGATDMVLLTAVLQEVYGSTIDAIAGDQLFDPLGLECMDWGGDGTYRSSYAPRGITLDEFARLGASLVSAERQGGPLPQGLLSSMASDGGTSGTSWNRLAFRSIEAGASRVQSVAAPFQMEMRVDDVGGSTVHQWVRFALVYDPLDDWITVALAGGPLPGRETAEVAAGLFADLWQLRRPEPPRNPLAGSTWHYASGSSDRLQGPQSRRPGWRGLMDPLKEAEARLLAGEYHVPELDLDLDVVFQEPNCVEVRLENWPEDATDWSGNVAEDPLRIHVGGIFLELDGREDVAMTMALNVEPHGRVSDLVVMRR